jgi:hypothetical protein
MPKISIITPIWCDVPEKVTWLSEMIESVQSQTLTDWEMILINDKSSLSLEPVKMKHAGDDRLRWIENAANFGPAMTRNTAAALAESECIFPLDADDMLANGDVLEYMYDAWLMDQTKIIYGNLQMYTEAAPGVFQAGKVIQLGEYTFELAMNLQGIMPVTAMHSKECHYEAGGWKDEMAGGLEDVEYWIAAGKRGYCGKKINHTTLFYRRQENSRAYKMRFIDKNFEVMQQKIKVLHSDIYNGRFPMACCGGRGGSNAPSNDPIIISQQAAQKAVRIVTTLDGYDEKDLEWVAYRGGKQGRFGSILARGPAGTPSEYPILGTGHVFQIHQAHRGLFEARQRLGFEMNQPDPRNQPEPEPERLAPPVEEPQVIEVPKPELSTIVQLDPVAAGTREIEIQPAPAEVIIEPNPPQSVAYSMPAPGVNVANLHLSSALTKTLDGAGHSIETLAEVTPEQLSLLPGIGIKRATTIIAKAKEYLNE